MSNGYDGRHDDYDNPDETVFDSFEMSYGGGAGLYVRLTRGELPVIVNIGVSHHRIGRTRYRTESGTAPVRGRADYRAIHIGVALAGR